MAERYSDTLTVRCPPVLNALVVQAAHRRGMTHSEYVRQAVLTTLGLDGFELTTIAARDAANEQADSSEASERVAV